MTNRGIWSLSGAGLTTVLSTQLNALASGSMSAASSTYANQTNLDLYCDLEVFLSTLGSAPAAGAYVDIYVLCAVDGTNFPAQSATDLRLTSTQKFCTVPVGTTSGSTQRMVVRNLLLPPQPIQFILDNQLSIALAATLNTVKIEAYGYNLNG
jgi:hypothetical protein